MRGWLCGGCFFSYSHSKSTTSHNVTHPEGSSNTPSHPCQPLHGPSVTPGKTPNSTISGMTVKTVAVPSITVSIVNLIVRLLLLHSAAPAMPLCLFSFSSAVLCLSSLYLSHHPKNNIENIRTIESHVATSRSAVRDLRWNGSRRVRWRGPASPRQRSGRAYW